jgi:GGDEF domain-containing protein
LALETVEELIIFIDLDNFKEISEEQGWVNYKPNEITGTLTELIANFIRKHVGEVIYGLDEKRGTEECMLRLAGALSHEIIISDLEYIASRIREIGFECGCETSVSIGVSRGPYTPIRPTGPYQWSKRLFKGQAQRLAHKALKKAKRQGGNRIVFL